MPISIVDGLLSLGVITREQLAAAAAVDDSEATTILGKLVAVGVDPGTIFPTASALARIPLASPSVLQSAYVVDGIAPEAVPNLRAALILPVRRDTDGVVDVVVAAPEALNGLASLGIPRFTAYLAEERVLRTLLDSVLPLRRPPTTSPSFDSLELAGTPGGFGGAASSSSAGGGGGAGWPSSSSMNASSMNASSMGDFGRAATPEEVAKQEARERREAATQAAAQMAREKAGQAAQAAKAGATAALTALREKGAPAAQAMFDKGVEGGGALASTLREKARGREKLVAAVAGGIVLLLIVVVIAVKAGGPSELEIKQRKVLAEAQAKDDGGEMAWAIAGYSRAIDVDPDSALAAQALLKRAIVEKKDGDIGDAGRDFDLVIRHPKSDPDMIKRARDGKTRLVE